MNAGIAHTRRTNPLRDAGSTRFDTPSPTFGPLRWWASRRLSRKGLAGLVGLTALLALRATAALAQNGGMLDERVTQQSIAETICRPGYADTVAPPFDEWLAHKDRMLTARGIDADAAADFALDRRVPIVLGGAPNAPANLDLLPWAGRSGERRKARAAVMLRRCVCEGKLSLAEAQATITGDWAVVYSGFGQTSCNVSRLDVATSGETTESGRSIARDGAP